MLIRAGGGVDSSSSTASPDESVKRPRGRPPNVTPSLNCSICNKDLISEPNSIQCDSTSCKKLFHPLCLGDEAPYDNEAWFCHQCQENTQEDPNCPVCRVDVGEAENGIVCERCNVWSHALCVQISEEEYAELMDSEEHWYCVSCQVIRANIIKWGDLNGEGKIRECVKDIYLEITTWK